MTIIVWDGETLAADRRTISSGLQRTMTKIWKVDNHLMGGAGDAATVLAMRDWFINGADPDKYPDCQRNDQTCCDFLVIKPDGTILKYEYTPFPIELLDDKLAIGSGRDFAYAAMELGADAAKAVEITSKYQVDCGNGVTVLTHDKEDA